MTFEIQSIANIYWSKCYTGGEWDGNLLSTFNFFLPSAGVSCVRDAGFCLFSSLLYFHLHFPLNLWLITGNSQLQLHKEIWLTFSRALERFRHVKCQLQVFFDISDIHSDSINSTQSSKTFTDLTQIWNLVGSSNIIWVCTHKYLISLIVGDCNKMQDCRGFAAFEYHFCIKTLCRFYPSAEQAMPRLTVVVLESVNAKMKKKMSAIHKKISNALKISL